MRVGLAAQSFPFPAPTGIVDFGLYMPNEDTVTTVGAQLQTPTGLSNLSIDVKAPLVKEKLGIVAGVLTSKLMSEGRRRLAADL